MTWAYLSVDFVWICSCVLHSANYAFYHLIFAASKTKSFNSKMCHVVLSCSSVWGHNRCWEHTCHHIHVYFLQWKTNGTPIQTDVWLCSKDRWQQRIYVHIRDRKRQRRRQNKGWCAFMNACIWAVVGWIYNKRAKKNSKTPLVFTMVKTLLTGVHDKNDRQMKQYSF